MHSAKILRLSTDLPIVIEIVDTQEKIDAFLPHLERMMGGGLVTLERVQIIHDRVEPIRKSAKDGGGRVLSFGFWVLGFEFWVSRPRSHKDHGRDAHATMSLGYWLLATGFRVLRVVIVGDRGKVLHFLQPQTRKGKSAHRTAAPQNLSFLCYLLFKSTSFPSVKAAGAKLKACREWRKTKASRRARSASCKAHGRKIRWESIFGCAAPPLRISKRLAMEFASPASGETA